MDAFEQLIASLLEREGFWVRSRFKVDLTKEEKRAIGRPSSPRWELDLVAYRGGTNELRVVECKSYLDSTGVSIGDVIDGGRYAHRYKLFTEPDLRRVVLGRLVNQMVAAGFCASSPTVILALAAGKLAGNTDEAGLRSAFDQRGWHLYDPGWIRHRLESLATTAYENDVAAVVSKLLMR